MSVTKHDVDKAILAYCDAYAAARSTMRSISGQVAKAAELGCRVTGGLPPPPRIVGLEAAERLLSCCTGAEKMLLRARYQVGARQSEPQRYTVNGEVKERRYWVLCSYDLLGDALGISARAVRERIAAARAKVAEMIGKR